MPHIFSRKIAFAALFTLAACAPPPSQPVAEPPVNLTDRERAARDVRVDPAQAASLISQYRDTHGLGAVTPDPILQGLAQAQADSMAAHNVLSHTIDGTLSARFDAVGLAQTTAVENVSAGYFSYRPHSLAGVIRRSIMPTFLPQDAAPRHCDCLRTWHALSRLLGTRHEQLAGKTSDRNHRSRRELLSRLLSNDIVSVPIRPIRILSTDPLLVLAMRRRGAPERACEFIRRGECRVVRVHASWQSCRDLLEQPPVAIRISE